MSPNWSSTPTTEVRIQVDNLEEAVDGYEILLGPYKPTPGYQVAIINDNGMPVKLIKTYLTPSGLQKAKPKNKQIWIQVN